MPRLDTLDRPAPEPADDPDSPRGLSLDVVHEAGDWAAIGAVAPFDDRRNGRRGHTLALPLRFGSDSPDVP